MISNLVRSSSVCLGYGAKNSIEEYQIYFVVGAVGDLTTKMIAIFFEKDEAKKVQ